MSPPAGSHSASSPGRGHTAASATDAVVTPGAPLSAATAISAIDQPVPVPGDAVEDACPPGVVVPGVWLGWAVGGAGNAEAGGGAGAVGGGGADAAAPPAGRIARPTIPFDELHAPAPASAGATATRTSATAELLELAGLVMSSTTASLASMLPDDPGQVSGASLTW